MKSERPWGWRLFLALDLIALVIGPMALYLTEMQRTDPAALSWQEMAALTRLPLLACTATCALLALLGRHRWGRTLLLGTVTLKYGLDLLIALLMLKTGFYDLPGSAYQLVRPLLLLGLHWVYLSHPQVVRYLT